MSPYPFAVALLCLAAGVAAAADRLTWLTVVGDSGSATSDSVQIEPESMMVFSGLRTIRIRVSRAHERTGYDDRPYRSYIASVQIDCSNLSANFRQLELFRGPLWTGDARVLNYREADMPLMVFRDVQPNPTSRIVQAACSIERVQTK
ncbi:MAG: hypothetical protein EOP77_05985 [Variovorax sp.]|nr:MAG: hypothetical protein EOP77_05985 [Variovorax sp.]